nr:uncharacterized protein LOC117274491 [Nicotiana tomentosiformis]
MAAFKALYGRRCRSPIRWFEIEKAELIRPGLVHQDMEKVSPMKGVMRFCKKGKLSPRYIGSYRIIQRIGQVAYRLERPPEISLVHLVFHASILKKVVGDLTLIIPVEAIEVNEELTYEEILITILNRKGRKLRNKEIASVKVLWRNQHVEESTWEAEEEMKKKYPHLTTPWTADPAESATETKPIYGGHFALLYAAALPSQIQHDKISEGDFAMHYATA